VSRRPVIRHAVSRRAVIAAAIGATVALSGCGFKGLYSAPLPGGADLGNHPFTVTAYFDDVLDLVPQSAVKVNDVPVGKVDAISLSECPVPSAPGGKGWCAKVRLSVRGTVDLPANARAEIQQTSLLGEKYVQLIQPPGPELASRLRSGSQIQIERTNSAPEAEDVLGALSLLLNHGGLEQIQSIAQELHKALATPQRQRATRDLITQLTTFTGTLDNQKDKITNALVSMDVLARTLNEQKSVITDALDTFPAALRVLRQERGKLVTLLTSLSKLGNVAGRVIDATQTELVHSLKVLDPVVTQLAAAGADLPGALRIMGTFPFPLGVSREFIKGDYANLDARLNLNLTDELCGLDPSGTLCKLLPLSTAKATNSAKVTPNSERTATLAPMLIGSGK
jgi:phospholipid/cholesterol/gamma-HCH transport system substrate-binding protein